MNESLFPVVDLAGARGLNLIVIPVDATSSEEADHIKMAHDIMSQHGSELWEQEEGDDEVTVEEIRGEDGQDAAEIWYYKILKLLEKYEHPAVSQFMALHCILLDSGAALFAQFVPELDVDPDAIIVDASEFD